ncbi:MAG: radical SAM protein [Nitrospinota bacterium]|nr:radical SAM protein [Nitrospinota bacterium]
MRFPWDSGLFPWRRKFPRYKRGLLLQWHITNRCQLRCAHCYQDEYGGGELGLDDLMGILEQYKALLGSLGGHSHSGRRGLLGNRGHVTITGGEPFAREDIWELLDALVAHRDLFGFAILTNGYDMDIAMARRLARLGPRFAQVSLEGTQEIHDRIRGEGDYDRVVKALKVMIRGGLQTMISFTAHSKNYRQFPDVAARGRLLGVGKVWTDRMVPCGGAATSNQDVKPLDMDQTREYLQIIDMERRKASRSFFQGTQVGGDRALQFLAEGGRPYRCQAGEGLITIMPDGSLYPCRRMPEAVGNVMETPLVELYHGAELFKSLRDENKISQGCERCLYRRFCRGGLKCMSHAALGDPFLADPGCPLAGASSQKEMNTYL